MHSTELLVALNLTRPNLSRFRILHNLCLSRTGMLKNYSITSKFAYRIAYMFSSKPRHNSSWSIIFTFFSIRWLSVSNFNGQKTFHDKYFTSSLRVSTENASRENIAEYATIDSSVWNESKFDFEVSETERTPWGIFAEEKSCRLLALCGSAYRNGLALVGWNKTASRET